MYRVNRKYGYCEAKCTKEIKINNKKLKVSVSVNFNSRGEAKVLSFKIRVNYSQGGWMKISKFTGKRMEMYQYKSIFETCGLTIEEHREVTDEVKFKDLHKTKFIVKEPHPYPKVLIKITFSDDQFSLLRISWEKSYGFSFVLLS